MFLCRKSFFGPISGEVVNNPCGPSFPFFLLFFSRFFVFFLALFFSFSHFLFISSFFDFLMFFIFSFFPKKFLLFFLLVFLSNILYCWRQYQSFTVSSEVCRRIISYTSYSRTNDCIYNGYDNSNLEHNAMINIDTVAHMNMHYTQY